MIPKTLQEAICRKEANKLLDQFLVGAPDEIDLDTIAWKVGHLRVEYGELDTAEGRLVATDHNGVIRVKASIASEGRRRFIIAHEIGHYRLHKTRSICDTLKNLSMWEEGNPETEANVFAGELLMPERLLSPRLKGIEPGLAAVDKLAADFRTSSLATAVQFVTYTKEPVALVVTIDGKMRWMRRSASFGYFIPLAKPPHVFTAAGEILSGKNGNTGGMVSVPAGAWLKGFDLKGRDVIMEDVREVRHYGMIVSLLWINEELGEDEWDKD